MKIYTEKTLQQFDFWGGALDTVSGLTESELNQVENVFEELYPDGINATDLNDIFAFDEDFVAQCCGFESWEDLEASHKRAVQGI